MAKKLSKAKKALQIKAKGPAGARCAGLAYKKTTKKFPNKFNLNAQYFKKASNYWLKIFYTCLEKSKV